MSATNAGRPAAVEALQLPAHGRLPRNANQREVMRYAEAYARAAIAAVAAAPAEPAAKVEPTWGYAKTVGNAIAQLQTMDPALPFYAALHLEDGRCIARGVTFSRERVVNERWIDNKNKDVPYSIVVWSQPVESLHAAPVSADAKKTAPPNEAWETMPVTVFIEHGKVDDCAVQRTEIYARAKSQDGHVTLYVRPRMRKTSAELDVLAERARQVSAEGWTPEHDDEHVGGELSDAAAAYAEAASSADHFTVDLPPAMWPWGDESWKPGDPRRMLVKAGALVLAEIERLDRAAARATTGEAQ